MTKMLSNRSVRLAALVAIFALSLLAGFAAAPAEARPPCAATCDQQSGYLWVCCPDGHGHWNCYLSSYPC